MMLDLSHSMVFKVLLLILVINIHLHEYSGTMAQFLFIQYEQNQGYVSKYTKKHIFILLTMRSRSSRLCLIHYLPI